jgi:hypothetical protein
MKAWQRFADYDGEGRRKFSRTHDGDQAQSQKQIERDSDGKREKHDLD